MKTNAKKLRTEHKLFIIQRVACYDGPKEVAQALKEEFNVEISPQAVEAYDPSKWAGRNLSKKWRDLFEYTRDLFLSDIKTQVPEANKSVRVRLLAYGARAFKQMGNFVAMANLLEQIAKETGNVYTNRRHLEAGLKADVTSSSIIKRSIHDYTEEELLAIIAGADPR